MSTTENAPEDPFSDFQWKTSEVSEMRKAIEKWKPAQTATRRTIEKNLVEVFLHQRGLDAPFLAGFVQKKCSLWFSNHTADHQEGTPDWCRLRLFTGCGLWYSKNFKEVEQQAGKDATFGMKNSQAAEMWKLLDEEEQEEWLDLAAEYNTKPPPPDVQRDYANKNMVHIVEEFIKFIFRVCGAAVFVYTTCPAVGGQVNTHFDDTTQYIDNATALQKHELWDTNTKVACLETFGRLLGMAGDEGPPALRDHNLFRRQRRDRSTTVPFEYKYGLPQPYCSPRNGKKMTTKDVYAHGCDFFRLRLSLATGDGVLLNSVPWSTIKLELEKYIPEEYLTTEFKDKFDCMSKMSVIAQKNWIAHILRTEASLPVPEDFTEPEPGKVFQVPEGRFHLLRGLYKPTAEYIPGQYRALLCDDITENAPNHVTETGKPTRRKKGKMAKRGRSGKGRATFSDEDDDDKFFEEEADKEDREEDEFDELRSGDGGDNDSDDNTTSDKEDQENKEDEDGDGDEVRKSLGIDETPTGASEDYDSPGYVEVRTPPPSGLRSPVVRRTTVLPAEHPALYGVKPCGVVPFLESLCAETQYQNLLTRVAKALETKVDIPPIPAAPWATWANVHGFIGNESVREDLDRVSVQRICLVFGLLARDSRQANDFREESPPPEFDSGDDFGQSALTLLRCGASNLLKGSFPECMNVLCDMMELMLEAGWKPKRTGPMPRPVKKKGKAVDNDSGPSSSTLPGNGQTGATEGITGGKAVESSTKKTVKPPQQPPRRSTRAVQVTAAGLAAGVKITSTPPAAAPEEPAMNSGGSSGNDRNSKKARQRSGTTGEGSQVRKRTKTQ
ncbi:uncharacterized protein BXZ73DRAFT_107735 [Epithele typhae]|uniref:uncharacterized protein n=1 Tax=Epithele typhae TaxID=378194 RepID=UPI00200847D9|nr:uncharacterized protein BXZ73DRAFT_107735 [Epithele typhae]KAH9911969.1 hypothetical protein BXZ73DRAFT_107735 [Epithele typhae]